MAYNLPIANYHQQPFGNGGTGSQALNLILQLVGQSSAGRDEARQANESRYNDILQLLGSLRGRTLDDLANMGQQQIADANKAYDDQRKTLLTDLSDRGLSGSTKRIAVEAMTKRERDAAVNRIKDALVANRTAADERLTTNATGVMERRSDPYPDTSNIGAIVTQLSGLLGGGLAGGTRANTRPSGLPQASYATYAARQPKPTMADVVAQVNAQRSAGAGGTGYDEQRRRTAMVELQKGIETGGLEGESRINNALAFLQANGWAAQNPAAATNALVDTRQYPQVPAYYGQGDYGGYPTAAGYQRVPLQFRDPVFASILAKRRRGSTPAVAQYGPNFTASTYGDWPVA
jgi:hypothetical protein